MGQVFRSAVAASYLATVCFGTIVFADQPATAPATAPASQPTTNPSKISLNFKDAPLDTVLSFLSQNAGFAILKDGTVDGRVTLMSVQPVSPSEAITMLNAALKSNGFTVTREDRLLRISARDKAKKGNVPVHFGNNPSDIAGTDELITQVIPIRNINALKLRDDLKPLMGADADITANEGSNSIIITDNSGNIRRIVQIIAALDEHEATTAELHVVQLKHANATATAKIVETLFKNGGGGASANPQEQQMRMQMMREGQPPPPVTGGSEKHGNSVVATADERTNTILVMASTETFRSIEDLLKKLDTDNPNPAPVTQMETFALKFAEAVPTAKLINSAFAAPSSGNERRSFYYRIFGDEEEQKKNEPGVTAVADERSNTVVVTAPIAKLAEVEALIKKLDASPMVSADLRVIHLKYANAFDVETLVEAMFKPKKDDEGGSPFRFLIIGDDSSGEKSGKGMQIHVTSDDRTNTLLVSAPKGLLDVIEKVVHELDEDPATQDSMFIYHLRNGQAAHLEYTLNVLFGNINNQNQNPQNEQNPNDVNQQNQQNERSNSRGVSQQTNTQNNSTNRTNRNNGRQGMTNISPNTAKAASELAGKVMVVAENDTNALLVTTASKYERQVRKIIEDLDRPVSQVLIKVLIAEVSHNVDDDLGLDFSILNLRASGNGSQLSSNMGNALSGSQNGGLVVSMLESNVTATLHALATQGKLDVLSRPYILASDNQQASISIGQSVPFVTESRLDTNNNTINTVDYRDVGVILNVTPHINPDGLVILDVAPEVSSFTTSSVQLSPGVSSPVFDKRTAASRVGIMNGQTIVIGGLMQDQKTSTVKKIPLLGDIPFIGLLFQRDQESKTKTELLIFLTPHVAANPANLQPMSTDETRGTKLVPDAVSPGVFADHLRGLGRGATTQSVTTQPTSPVNSIDLTDPAGKSLGSVDTLKP